MKMLGSTDFCWLLKVGRWARIERPQPLAVVQRSPAENEKCSVPDVAHATRQTPTTVFLFFFLTDAPLPPLPRHATFPFSRTRTHSEVTKWLCGRLCVVDERYKWIRPIELR